MDSRLRGKHILIVEDDYFLASDVHKALESQGAVIIGPVTDVEGALAIINTVKLDGAVLDIALNEEDSFPIADELLRKQIPFVFASGVNRDQIPGRFEGFRLLSKPAEIRLIIEALVGLPH